VPLDQDLDDVPLRQHPRHHVEPTIAGGDLGRAQVEFLEERGG
jgi:hypothetical protein